MSNIIQQVNITLNGAPVRECSYSVELNGSVDWSAVVAADAVDVSTMTGAETFTLNVSVTDSAGGSASWTSPPLVCPDPEEYSGRAGEYVTLQGSDLASWLMTATGHSASTIHDTMAQSLASTIATLAGVGVTFTGSPVNWRCEDFEITGDSQIGECLKRLCRDGGWMFRPHSSGLEVFDIEYTPSSSAALYYESWKRSRRNSQRYSQLVMQSQRKYKGQYVFPIDSQAEEVQTGDLAPGLDVATLTANPMVTGGGVQYAAFYDEPSGGGGLCGFIALDLSTSFPVTITSLGPALSVVYKVKAPTPPVTATSGNLVITGRPPSAYTYDPPATVSTAAGTGRSKILRMESTLWDTTAFMNSRKAAILAAANSGCDVLEFSGVRFDPRFNAGDTVAPAGLPPSQIHSVSWSYSGGRVSQSLVTHVL